MGCIRCKRFASVLYCNFLRFSAYLCYETLVSVKSGSAIRVIIHCELPAGGKRIVRYFVHRKEPSLRAEKQIELLNEGRKHGELTEEERRAVIMAREIARR